MTAFFLSNISVKYYKNLSMLSRVIAKNVGDVFLRHSVDTSAASDWHTSVLLKLTTIKKNNSLEKIMTI